MKLTPSQPISSAGFTLLEILLALVVFAVVVAAVNSIFYGALRLRNKTYESLARSVEVEHALKIIKRDIANILPSGGTMSGELQTSAMGGMTGANSPVIYTSTGLMNEFFPFGKVQKVSYIVGGSMGGTGGNDLYRNVTRNLLPQTQEDITSEILLSGVQSLTFQFFDGATWRTTWDSAAETTVKLPTAIKASLILSAADGTKRLPAPIDLVALVVVTGSTNTTATATGTTGGQR